MKKLLALLFVSGLLVSVSTVTAQRLKVMSYNIHIGQDASNIDQLEKMAGFIKSSGADLVGLQEVDSVCNRSGKVDQIRVLAEKTGMHFAYARHFAFDGGSYGIGILSRFPLENIRDHRIILTSEGTADAATRALLSGDVKVGRQIVRFVTVHMDYRDSKSRLAQAIEIVQKFKTSQIPVVLTGDFNARPGSPEVNKLMEVFAETGILENFTFPVVAPKAKIDYIVVSKDALGKVKYSIVPQVTFSDHLPIISEFRLKN